ncbi:MAG: GNAT family N-acetyltransferase [Deltaproteobacteria bacterium]|nr:GNAT family N-acetyltransferase [Deltaproteobacteria bacterium]
MASLVKSSGSFLVRPYESRDFQALRDMRWIQGLLETGENFLAWREGSVVGHGVILPDLDKKDAEYLVFVSRGERGKGVGTALTRAVLDHAAGLGLESVWLTVGAYNMRAARLYRKFSFRFLEEPGAGSERTMVLTL